MNSNLINYLMNSIIKYVDKLFIMLISLNKYYEFVIKIYNINSYYKFIF